MELDPECKNRIPNLKKLTVFAVLEVSTEYKLTSVLKILALSFTTL